MNELKNKILKKASNVEGEGKFLAILLGERISKEGCFLKNTNADKSKRDVSIFISNEKSLVVLYFNKFLEDVKEIDYYFEFLSNKNIVSSSIYAFSKESEIVELDLTEDFDFNGDLKEKFCFQ